MPAQAAAAVAYARADAARLVADLERFPSVSSMPRFANAVAACATGLASQVRRAGLEYAEAVATKRHPIMRESWLGAPSAPTLTLPNDGMHGPNERFLHRNLARGVEASIWMIAELPQPSERTPLPQPADAFA